MIVMYDSVACMYWLAYTEISYTSSLKMPLTYTHAQRRDQF